MNHIDTYNRARQSTPLPSYPWHNVTKHMPKGERETADMIAKTYASTLERHAVRTARIEVGLMALAILAAVLLSVWGLV